MSTCCSFSHTTDAVTAGGKSEAISTILGLRIPVSARWSHLTVEDMKARAGRLLHRNHPGRRNRWSCCGSCTAQVRSGDWSRNVRAGLDAYGSTSAEPIKHAWVLRNMS